MQSNEIQCILPLVESLSQWNLDTFIDEIVFTIYGIQSREERRRKGISHWNQKRLVDWICSLKCLQNDSTTLSKFIQKEVFDGETFQLFLELDEAYELLNISDSSYFIIKLILQHWKNPLIPTSLEYNHLLPLGVKLQKVADLSEETEELVHQIVEANQQATSGIGYIYGQMVVLGFSEYRIFDKKWVPYGFSNLKLVLKRRKVPNGVVSRDESSTNNDHLKYSQHPSRKIIFDLSGLERTDTTASTVEGVETSTVISTAEVNKANDSSELIVELRYTPLYDMYQFGRAVHSTNDFVIPGYLHMGEDGVYCGPINRWAFRILCERLPPFRSFMFAGGFNDLDELVIPGCYYDHEDGIDGFTKFGLRIFPPEGTQWMEVSVLGHTYESKRYMSDVPHAPNELEFGNQLLDGTLIDIGGVILMFQDPITMANGLKSQSLEYIKILKEIKSQCPVLFNEIKVNHTHPMERLQNVVSQAEEEDIFPLFHRLGPVHIPTSDYSSIEEDHRAYVYPACGHIYAYHRSLEENPCPLCRQKGVFVPLATVNEPTLCDGPLTHVFNPCGHVVSEDCANHWSNLMIFPKQLPSYGEVTAICPFCAVELNLDRPCSKLVFPSGINSFDEIYPATTAKQSQGKILNWQQSEFQEQLMNAQLSLFQQEFPNKQPGKDGNAHRSCYPVYAPQIGLDDK